MTTTPLDRFERALGLLERRGKVTVIIYLLAAGSVRFSALAHATPGISQRRLVQCLRELEADGVVHRLVHRHVPPRVEYSLTAWGRAFAPIVCSLRVWAEASPLC